VNHAEGKTTFVVGGLDEVWPDRGTILLEAEPLVKNAHIEVHPGPSRFVFYRGVRVFEPPHPTAFTYNITAEIELTEDRTAKNWFSTEIQIERGIGQLEDQNILRRILTCGELFQEHHMNVPAYGMPAEPFKEMARALTFGPEAAKVNPNAASRARASAVETMNPGDGMELSATQSAMLLRAKWLLLQGGIEIEAFPVICVETLGPSIHGLAKDGKIFLTGAAFDKGTRELAATLFEEFAHLKSGAADCTRPFQNWLIDRLLITIENHEGEPF
jgi:hypothetical protein